MILAKEDEVEFSLDHRGRRRFAGADLCQCAAKRRANYPNKPVKMIASSPAGGGVDIIARLIGERLQKRFGQPFIVENRAGAGGGVGAEPVYHSEPDGYTLQ